MTKKFSRHTNEQYRWMEQARVRIVSTVWEAAHFKWTQQEYLDRREAIFAEVNKKLTRDRVQYLRGYERCLGDDMRRKVLFVRRITGKPETATHVKWDNMTEEMQEACREHRTESCLAWDERGEFVFTPWLDEYTRLTKE
jgi:hypothetical protein